MDFAIALSLKHKADRFFFLIFLAVFFFLLLYFLVLRVLLFFYVDVSKQVNTLRSLQRNQEGLKAFSKELDVHEFVTSRKSREKTSKGERNKKRSALQNPQLAKIKGKLKIP